MTRMHAAMLERFGVEVAVAFTPLYSAYLGDRRGSLRRLLSSAPAPKPFSGPLALPQNKRQCVHVAELSDELSDGVQTEYMRCPDYAKFGFLCRFHDNALLGRKAPAKPRSFDAETIQNIINTEAKALFACVREVVVCDAKGKTTIQLVKGLRMNVHPDTVLTPEEVTAADEYDELI